MTRLIFLCICIISILVSSCNNNDTKTGDTVSEKEKELRELITKYPDSFLLKENLVQYFREKGNYAGAISETETILKKDSLNTRFLDIKATLHFENGDTIDAIKTFEKAMSIDPHIDYVISLGSLYAQTKNPLALSMAETLMRSPAINAQKQAVFIKGLYYSYSGDKVKAIPYFDTCLKIDYRDVLAYREKAICLYDLNEYTAALDVLQKAVAVQQTFDEGYYWMGRCYEKLNKKKEAIDNYQLALTLDSNFVEAKEALGRINN